MFNFQSQRLEPLIRSSRTFTHHQDSSVKHRPALNVQHAEWEILYVDCYKRLSQVKLNEATIELDRNN